MIDENLLHAFLTLMLCVLGLGVVLFLVKRYSAKITPQKQSVDMKILGRLPLQKANIYTIQAGDRTLIIGTTDHSIITLADISTHATEAPLPTGKAPTQVQPLEASPADPTDNLSFSAFLHSISHRHKN